MSGQEWDCANHREKHTPIGHRPHLGVLDVIHKLRDQPTVDEYRSIKDERDQLKAQEAELLGMLEKMTEAYGSYEYDNALVDQAEALIKKAKEAAK